MTPTLRVLVCRDCGDVGNRTFKKDPEGVWRDVLGGDRGVTPDDTACDCGSRRWELTRDQGDLTVYACGCNTDFSPWTTDDRCPRCGDPIRKFVPEAEVERLEAALKEIGAFSQPCENVRACSGARKARQMAKEALQ